MTIASTANNFREAKIMVSQAAPCQQQLRISLPAIAIHPVRDVVVREFQKEASLAGFRKGKAPRELVERRFPAEIREETIRRLTRQLFEQVTEERQLKPVGPFEVTKLDFDEQKGLELEAQVEVEPEFALADYRGIRLNKPAVTVGAQAIEQALAQLQESMAELVPVPRPQASGSLAEDPERTRGTGEGLPAPTAVGAPACPATGVAADRQAGTPPQKVKRLPNLDDEFAKDAGFENLQQLRQHLEAKLREQHEAQARQALEQTLCDELLTRHQFEVPPRLVVKHTERLSRDFQVRLLLGGASEEQVKQELATYTEQLRTNAIRLVKLTFILDRIAAKEELSITQDEVVDRLWKLAKRWGKDPAEARRLLDAKGFWPSVVSSIRQDKTISRLLSLAQIEEISPLTH